MQHLHSRNGTGAVRRTGLVVAIQAALALGAAVQVQAQSFPATTNLASLDGTTGFRLDGVADSRAGRSVNNAGDINGDGIDDLIIGALRADPGSLPDAGSSYVVFGHSGGFPATMKLDSLDGSNGFRIDGTAAGDISGIAVSGAGDVNGDGIDDVIVGAGLASPGGRHYAGSSYVVFGHSGNFAPAINLGSLDGSTGFRLDGVAAEDRSGFSVSGVGDLNGDGMDDIVMGAFTAAPNGMSKAGSSYVVFGHSSGFASAINLGGLDGSTGFRLDGEASNDRSGISVSGAGDVNGDGFADMIVGAGFADPGASYDAGSSYVVFGHSGGFAATMDLASLDGNTGFRIDGADLEYSGTSVHAAGDVNGDGFADVIIAAYGASRDGTFSGSSYVVFGHGGAFTSSMALSSLDGSTGFRLDGAADMDFLGRSVSGAGDLNGDGVDDVIVGADHADGNGAYSGSSYVVYGHSSAFPVATNVSALDGGNGFRLDGAAANDFSGRSVRTAGDINGDGIADLIIGAPYADPNGDMSAGSSYVVFGRASSVSANNPTRGLYWDRARNGQGFDLQRSGPNWFLLMYTYRNDNTPLWYLGTGMVSSGVFSGTASQFDYDAGRDPKAQAIPGTGGPVNIDFTQAAVNASSACNDGTDRSSAIQRGAFHFDLDGAAGDWCVEPFQFGVGTAATDFTGSWFNSDDSGWGLTLYTKQSTTPGGTDLVVVLYYYDAAGKPRWSLGVVLDADLSNDVNVDMSQFTGFCPTCTPVPPVGAMSGTMKLTLTNPSISLTAGNKATINVDFLGAPGGQWVRTDSPIQELSDLAR